MRPLVVKMIHRSTLSLPDASVQMINHHINHTNDTNELRVHRL